MGWEPYTICPFVWPFSLWPHLLQLSALLQPHWPPCYFFRHSWHASTLGLGTDSCLCVLYFSFRWSHDSQPHPPWGFVRMSSLEGFPNTPILSRDLLHLTSTLFLAFSADHIAPYDILCLLPQIVNAMREGSFVYFVPCCILSSYFNSSWHIVGVH